MSLLPPLWRTGLLNAKSGEPEGLPDLAGTSL
jgi:hypothetical protein